MSEDSPFCMLAWNCQKRTIPRFSWPGRHLRGFSNPLRGRRAIALYRWRRLECVNANWENCVGWPRYRGQTFALIWPNWPTCEFPGDKRHISNQRSHQYCGVFGRDTNFKRRLELPPRHPILGDVLGKLRTEGEKVHCATVALAVWSDAAYGRHAKAGRCRLGHVIALVPAAFRAPCHIIRCPVAGDE